MPEWLTEGSAAIYLVLAAAEIVLLTIWWRTRKRRYAIAAAAVAVIALILLIFDWAYEGRHEQVKRKLNEMATAVAAGDMDRIFSHISEEFRYGSTDKRTFRSFCDEVRQRRNVNRMAVWDVVFPDSKQDDRSIPVEFRFKIQGNWSGGQESFYCKAKFHHDADGQWRLQTFDVFNPFVEMNQPLAIPGLQR